jgi:hypothetical protein
MGVVAGVGLASAECNFEPERIFGKAEVLEIISFDLPRRNKCLRERGRQTGRIRFRFEPEGTQKVEVYTAYYDAMTQCFNEDDRQIDCSQVPVGREIREVGFLEKERRPGKVPRKRGILTRLFIVP